MIIFRFSGALLATTLAGCAQNMPPSQSELGKIARIGVYEERSVALRRWAEGRLADRPRLRHELLSAGFRAELYENCEYFRWRGRDWGVLFDEVMVVGLCGDTIETNSGAIAP